MSVDPDPVHRFLGDVSSTADPRRLLGVTGEGGRAAIEDALARRLEQVDRHPERGTPAAEEVRLALFAAAWQIAQQAPPATVTAAVPGGAPPPWLAGAVRASVVVARGWNRRALRLLGAIAMSRGLSPVALPGLVGGLARRSGGPAAAPPATAAVRPAAPAAAAEPAEESRGGSGWLWIVLVVIVGAGLLGAWGVALSLGLLTPTVDGTPVPTGPMVQAEPRQASPPHQLAVDDRVASPERLLSRDLMQPEALLETLRRSSATLAFSRVEAVRVFEEAAAVLAVRWDTLSPDQLREANGSVVSFVYGISDTPELREEALTGVLAPLSHPGPFDAEATTSWAWSAGIAARLSGIADLPAPARRAVRDMSRRSATIGATGFHAGARQGLRTLLDDLIAGETDIETWKAWVSSVQAASEGASDLAEPLLRDGVEAMLTSGPDPVTDPGTRAGIGVLISSMSWRGDAGAPRWVLRLLADPTYDAHDLNAVTEALVSLTGAPNVNASMVLSAGADEASRRDLRRRLGEAWGLDLESELEGMLVAVREAAQREGSVGDAPQGPREAAARAAKLAWVVTAARHTWNGDALAAQSTLDGVALIAEAASARTPAERLELVLDRRPTANRWALEFIPLTSIDQQTDAIEQLLGGPSPMGLIDAEVLIETAFRGKTRDLRESASQTALARSSEPAVLAAALEMLAKIPPTRANSSVLAALAGVRLSSLPAPTEDTWRPAVRAALAEVLVETLAGAGIYGSIDSVSSAITETYGDRLGLSIGAVPPDPADLARALSNGWLDQAVRTDRLLLPGLAADDIRSRRAARLRLARGPVQQFAAEQWALVESAAAAVSGERPIAAGRITEVLEEFAAERADAIDVFAQIAAGEHALARIWIIRMETPAP